MGVVVEAGSSMRKPGGMYEDSRTCQAKARVIFLLIDITSYMHICQRIGEVWCKFKELSNIGSNFLLIHPML